MSTEKPDAQPYLLPPEREIHPARVNATVRALREAQAEVNRLASVERKTQATLRRLRRRLEACETTLMSEPCDGCHRREEDAGHASPPAPAPGGVRDYPNERAV